MVLFSRRVRMLDERLGKYRVEGELGRGGMAIVYRGYDEALNRPVAIKVMHAHLLRDAEALARFHREATTAANLNHPHIVEIYDYSGPMEQGSRYLVMEFIDGMSLADFIDRRRLRHSEVAAAIGMQIAAALAHAHAHDVVHRDLKPDNIMIRRADGRAKLTDFGIARLLDGQNLTITSTVLGSPAYMSPEMIEGGEVDSRSDIFSLGTLLYQMVTGQIPFTGPNPHAMLRAISEANYPDPELLNPFISHEFKRLIARCLKRDPADRYQSAAVVQRDLKDICVHYGVNDPEDLAARYFLDPQATEERFEPVLIETLTRQASAAAEEGRTKEAIAHCNRLFAFDPHDETASGIMQRITEQGLLLSGDDRDDDEAADDGTSVEQERMTKRRRRRLGAMVSGAALLLAALATVAVAGGWFSGGRRPTLPDNPNTLSTAGSAESGAPPSLARAPDMPEAANATDLPTVNPPPETTPGAADVQPRRAAPPRSTPGAKSPPERNDGGRSAVSPVADTAAKGPKGVIKVFTSPWAHVYIDDVKQGTTPLDREFEVPLGEHLVRLENPGCEPVSRIIQLTEGQPSVAVRTRLTVLPAYLRVNAEHGVDVYVDGQFRGQTPLAWPLSISMERHNGGGGSYQPPAFSRAVRLEFRKQGFSPQVRTLTLNAGNVHEVAVTLLPR